MSPTRLRRQRCRSAHAARLLVLSITLASGTLAGAAQDFTGLGQIPGGTGSIAVAISSEGGVVVGTARNGQGIAHPFRWDPANGMVDLGVFQGGQFAEALGVNSDGSVVVGFGDMADSNIHGFRWTADQGLVDLGVLPNASFAEPQAISADGHVVVGGSGQPLGVATFQAFRWTEQAGMQGLGTLAGDLTSFATGASDDGSVIVGTSTDATGFIGRAFVWTAATGMHGIGHLPGGSITNARAVSGNGLVTVGIGDATEGVRAFRWTAQGMTSLGTVPGTIQSAATCTNEDGSVVGGSCLVTPSTGIASLWMPATGMVNVNVLLSSAGTDLTGWRLVETRAVNGDGSIIAGAAIHNGTQEAWITSLPAPSSCGSADFNCDGDVGTDADIESFFACLSGVCPASPCAGRADFNADGDVGTDADIEAFFRVLGGGSC